VIIDRTGLRGQLHEVNASCAKFRKQLASNFSDWCFALERTDFPRAERLLDERRSLENALVAVQKRRGWLGRQLSR
jgi:hypothetical protein